LPYVPGARAGRLRWCEIEKRGQALWNPEQSDRDLIRDRAPRVASEARLPAEARVGTLRTGKESFRIAWRNRSGRHQTHLDALVRKELHTGAPMHSSAPVSPEERSIPDHEWR
jgi:hypothetical protein